MKLRAWISIVLLVPALGCTDSCDADGTSGSGNISVTGGTAGSSGTGSGGSGDGNSSGTVGKGGSGTGGVGGSGSGRAPEDGASNSGGVGGSGGSGATGGSSGVGAGGGSGSGGEDCDVTMPYNCPVCTVDDTCDTPTYTDNGDGTVTSSCCGLVWQQVAEPGKYMWEDAKSYCAGLSFAGGGWRLPETAELNSLLLLGQTPREPTIDRIAFPNTPPEPFWSGTMYEFMSSRDAWYADFYGGYSTSRVVNGAYHARCVR